MEWIYSTDESAMEIVVTAGVPPAMGHVIWLYFNVIFISKWHTEFFSRFIMATETFMSMPAACLTRKAAVSRNTIENLFTSEMWPIAAGNQTQNGQRWAYLHFVGLGSHHSTHMNLSWRLCMSFIKISTNDSLSARYMLASTGSIQQCLVNQWFT